MSKRLWTVTMTAGLLLAAGSVVWAMPSLGGPTGIVSLPNAEICPTSELQTAVSELPFDTLGMYGGNDATAWTLQALRGVSSKAELWGAYSRVHDGADTDIWQIGGKVQLDTSILADTKIAVGGSLGRWTDAFGLPYLQGVGMDTAVADADILKGYVVATREISPVATAWERAPMAGTQIIGSAGLFYLSADSDEAGSATLLRPFAAVEIVQGMQTLALEWRWKDSDLENKDVFSCVLRRPIGAAMEMEIGTTNASPIGLGLGNQNFFLRVGYDQPQGSSY